ncbi:MAG: epoxyqueuosine reductase QueH [Bacilli bacterium]|nr:epoxyqueuosine reductase QueH [Bacilli bacterium]
MEEIKSYKEFLEKIEDLKQEPKKKILIHACCGPCSSEVIDFLKDVFDITIYYYNPNIYPKEEYEKRYDQFSLLPYKFDIVKGEYEESKYYDVIKGYEDLGEFSKRCYKCFYFRLEEAAIYASVHHFDYFTTTLSISPYKNSKWINEIGYELSKKYNIEYLYSDFKKQEGYKKSIELSKKYKLYRQEYCGCKYSMEEAKSKNI